MYVCIENYIDMLRSEVALPPNGSCLPPDRRGGAWSVPPPAVGRSSPPPVGTRRSSPNPS